MYPAEIKCCPHFQNTPCGPPMGAPFFLSKNDHYPEVCVHLPLAWLILFPHLYKSLKMDCFFVYHFEVTCVESLLYIFSVTCFLPLSVKFTTFIQEEVHNTFQAHLLLKYPTVCLYIFQLISVWLFPVCLFVVYYKQHCHKQSCTCLLCTCAWVSRVAK